MLLSCYLGCATEDEVEEDPVGGIVNGESPSSYDTYWELDLSGGGEWAFLADGSGVYRHGAFAPDGADFAWEQLGDDALLLTIDVPSITNFAQIEGGISEGLFTAVLDGNPTRRTFVLRSGTLE